jgi:hypothetical protein
VGTKIPDLFIKTADKEKNPAIEFR